MANREFFFEPEEKLNPDVDSDEKLDVLIVKEIRALQRKAKQLEITTKGAQTTDRLVIFIHGYYNDEQAINIRASGIDIRLGTSQVITTAFNWSSYARLLKYKGDQQRAEKLSPHFVFYLQQVRQGEHHKFNQIDIICHSMGNFILAHSIFHSERTKQLSVFNKCNIVCVAADVPFKMYEKAISAVRYEISSWVHYYNKLDHALLLSNVSNRDKLRAGQTACTVQHGNKIVSSHWKKDLFSHGYIDDVFGADDELTNDVLRRLNLLNISCDADKAEMQEQTQRYSVLYSELYKGVGSKSGESWWNDLSRRSVAKYGVFKLQEHKSKDSGLIGAVRAVAPWSNHNFKYRILHTFERCQTKKEESKVTCTDVYHDDDKQKMEKKFAEYLEMIEWRKKIDQANK